jgi:hypothetical protein
MAKGEPFRRSAANGNPTIAMKSRTSGKKGLCPFTPKFHQQKPELEAGRGSREKGPRKLLYRRGKARETSVQEGERPD